MVCCCKHLVLSYAWISAAQISMINVILTKDVGVILPVDIESSVVDWAQSTNELTNCRHSTLRQLASSGILTTREPHRFTSGQNTRSNFFYTGAVQYRSHQTTSTELTSRSGHGTINSKQNQIKPDNSQQQTKPN